MVIDLGEKKLSVVQVLDRNRSLVIAILGLPVFGMLIATVLILYTKPDNMLLVFAVIFFIAVQYLVMMFFLMKKIRVMAAKEEAEEEESMEEDTTETDETDANEPKLKSEEERVLPLEE